MHNQNINIQNPTKADRISTPDKNPLINSKNDFFSFIIIKLMMMVKVIGYHENKKFF